MTKSITMVAAILMLSSATHAADADPRPLTGDEQKSFFPLVCAKPIAHNKDATCAQVVGYPNSTASGAVSLSLDAIAFGPFTKAGADEAYVTYSSSFEPHASNFGGGILFERAHGAWRLMRWYSGGQMDHCVALPGGTTAMLCLSGWTGQGETDSSVWLNRVPKTNGDGDFAKAATAILKAQDDREAGSDQPAGNYQCTLKRKPDEAILLSIDDLKRAPGALAASNVVYATPRDVAAACADKSFANVRETKGVVRYVLRDGKVVSQTPAPFAAPDY